jgi:hypothetical protein
MLPTNLLEVKIAFLIVLFALQQYFHVIKHSKGYPLTYCMSKKFVCSAHSEGAGVARAFVMLTGIQLQDIQLGWS